VGSSASPERDSYHITKYLMLKGYNVFPVNPKYNEVLKVKCYPKLQDIPFAVEIVNVFRRPDQVLPVVKDALAINAKVIWFQFDVSTQEVVEFALDNRLIVIDSRCIMVEHRRLIG
jgi:predicted CoA-binding protein